MCDLPTLRKLLDLVAAFHTPNLFCLKERDVYVEILFVTVHCVALPPFLLLSCYSAEMGLNYLYVRNIKNKHSRMLFII